MLECYFLKPQTVDRIRGCWLGAAIERYVTWLSEHAYRPQSVHHRVPLLVQFAAFTHQRGATQIAQLPDHVEAFVQQQLAHRIRRRRTAAAQRQYIRDVRSPMHHFLRVIRQDENPSPLGVAYPLTRWAPNFFGSLQEERGLRLTTIEGYAVQLRAFERYVTAQRLDGPQALTPSVLDRFLAERRLHVCARSLTMTCAALRAFLRYLFRQGLVVRDLSAVIEGPSTYRFSHVVRSVSADEVHRVLRGIDRRSTVGKRDYALLLVLIVYGLRAREVAALTLEDIDWRASRLHVRARKGGHEALYPLATEVGDAVLDYVQHGRPPTRDRHLFLRLVAPQGAVTSRIVADRATHALRRAGVAVARPGSHTLRHSCAQRLVDAGYSLKAIGDYLGHRRAASTRIYTNVDLEALRDIALGDGEALV